MKKLDVKLLEIIDSHKPLSRKDALGFLKLLESNTFIKIVWLIVYYTKPFLKV